MASDTSVNVVDWFVGLDVDTDTMGLTSAAIAAVADVADVADVAAVPAVARVAPPVLPVATNVVAQPAVPAKATTRPVVPAKATTQPVVPAKATTQPVAPAKATTQPVAPAKATTQPAAPAKDTTQPVAPAKDTTQTAAPAKAKPRVRRRVSPAAEEDRDATEDDKDATEDETSAKENATSAKENAPKKRAKTFVLRKVDPSAVETNANPDVSARSNLVAASNAIRRGAANGQLPNKIQQQINFPVSATALDVHASVGNGHQVASKKQFYVMDEDLVTGQCVFKPVSHVPEPIQWADTMASAIADAGVNRIATFDFAAFGRTVAQEGVHAATREFSRVGLLHLVYTHIQSNFPSSAARINNQQ
jgi:hypothetical protein